MRILICIRQFPLNEDFIYDEVLGLSRSNDVRILCREYGNNRALPQNLFHKIDFIENSIVNKIKAFLAKHDLYLSYKENNVKNQISKIINSFKPDVIQCDFGDDALFFIDNMDHDIPCFVMFHGYDASAWLRNRTYILKYKRLLRSRQVIPVTISDNMRKRMADKGLDMSGSYKVHCGVDTQFFKRDNYDIRPPVFLQVSVFRTKKGHIYTLKAFRRFMDKFQGKEFKLVFAGDGGLKKEIENLAERLNMADHVEFTGWADKHGVRKLMNEASCYVHHSVTTADGDKEGIPVSIMEAMSMELPVLSTVHSGIPELVENNVNGILVEEMDIDGYAKAINDIMAFKFLRKNREKVRDHFEINSRIEQLEGIFIKHS